MSFNILPFGIYINVTDIGDYKQRYFHDTVKYKLYVYESMYNLYNNVMASVINFSYFEYFVSATTVSAVLTAIGCFKFLKIRH